MQINVAVDDALLLRRLEKGEKRFGYSVVAALNDTALQMKADVLERDRATFRIRDDQSFFLRKAALVKLADVRQQRPYADVYVGVAKGLLLGQFEEGGERLPFKGQSVAVPLIGEAARPSFAETVPAALRFQALHLRLTSPRFTAAGRHPRRSRVRSKEQGRVRFGAENTYLIPGVGVFQRAGKTSHLIYAFVRSEQLPPKLAFLETAEASAHRHFRENLQRQILDVFARHGVPA